MKMTFTREFYIPKDSIEIRAADCSAVAYLTIPTAGKITAKAFSGKRAKPDWFYSFRDEAQARARIASHAAAVRERETAKQAHAAQRQVDKCRTPLDVWNKVRAGNDYISAAETAICLRATLQKHFPEVKFSVTSENYAGGCSVRVSWTDGPLSATVNEIAREFSFAGFDGMIDMEYGKRRWLSRDGEMSLAHSQDTGGSAGSCPEQIGSAHAPDCVLVRYGAKYVTASRELSFAHAELLARAIAGKYGEAVPETFADENALWRWINGCRVQGADEYLSSLMHRKESEVVL